MLRTSVEITTNCDIDTRFKKYNIIAFVHICYAFYFSLYIQRDPYYSIY